MSEGLNGLISYFSVLTCCCLFAFER